MVVPPWRGSSVERMLHRGEPGDSTGDGRGWHPPSRPRSSVNPGGRPSSRRTSSPGRSRARPGPDRRPGSGSAGAVGRRARAGRGPGRPGSRARSARASGPSPGRSADPSGTSPAGRTVTCSGRRPRSTLAWIPSEEHRGPSRGHGDHPGPEVVEVDDPDFQGVAAPRDQAGEQVHRRLADEPGDESAGRAVVEVERPADLRDPAAIEHGDPVADRQGLGLVVGDQDHRRPELAVESDSSDRVEARSGASSPENGSSNRKRLGAEDQRPAQRDPSPLATRERPRPPAEAIGQPQDRRRGPDPLLDLGFGDPPGTKPEGDVLEGVEVRIEHLVLEDHRHVAVAGGRPSIGGRRAGGSPSRAISRPATSRSSVLLPDPEGPTITNSSPSSTVRSTPRTAAIPPG